MYAFCSLTDRLTGKLFKEYMIIIQMNIRNKKNQTSILNSDQENHVSVFLHTERQTYIRKYGWMGIFNYRVASLIKKTCSYMIFGILTDNTVRHQVIGEASVK